jgi:hypothetical protein
MNSNHATPSLTDIHSSLLGNLIFLAKKVSKFQPSHFELPYSYSPYQTKLQLSLLDAELPFPFNNYRKLLLFSIKKQ